MMRSLFSGISGLKVHQTKMDVIANNIANVNTIGYKSARTTFADFFSQSLNGASAANEATGKGGTNPTQIGLGVSLASIDINMNAGLGQRTDRNLDLMIEGSGMFIVGDDQNGRYFTRAGAFNLDEAGNLVNSAGLKVNGWEAVDDPQNPGRQKIVKSKATPIQIDGDKVKSPPQPTSNIEFTGNLNAITSQPDGQNTSMSFYDTLGNRYTVDCKMVFDPIAGTWASQIGDRAYVNGDTTNQVALTFAAGAITLDNSAAAVQALPSVEVFQTTSTLVFDNNGLVDPDLSTDLTGAPLAVVPATVPPTARLLAYTVNPSPVSTLPVGAAFGTIAGGVADGIVNVDVSSLTQWDASANATTSTLNGYSAGELSGLSVGKDGKIVGTYTNGQTRVLNQIAVANFTNPAGLEKVGNNLFSATLNSGDFDGIGQEVGANGGAINGGVLEMSNVDLSTEFTDMITTQRGFEANSKSITTSDEMLQTLTNLKR